MGTYCSNNCGQKLIGYLVPSTCECKVERFCCSCWHNVLFAPRYKKYESFIVPQTYVVDDFVTGPRCKTCGEKFVREMYEKSD